MLYLRITFLIPHTGLLLSLYLIPLAQRAEILSVDKKYKFVQKEGGGGGKKCRKREEIAGEIRFHVIAKRCKTLLESWE